ncbi:Outer membrane protein OmpA [Flavobacterium swingsii]|uniref:Outer membrane protein OmpA n=1 Tax=Flavobacterium swingsii TaxID=498292 RepID=A0A1I0V158_9FLAO|nr:OmpA family protein [Flavobacterium swingsii]SFA69863.1 Outer membrane protein OmpA [Flavobacterium swingsii]
MGTLKSKIVFLLTLSFLFSGYAQEAQFVSGKKILFEEKFSKDIMGDFPVNWFTNSSGEIANISSSKWLQLSDKGSFYPMSILKLPENFTFEFDVTTTDNFNFYSTPLNVVFTEKTTKADNVWNTTLKRKEAVIFNVHPANSLSGTGRSEIFVISEKKEIMKNKVDIPVFNKNKNTVRVQIWRQKNRFRMFIDGKKFWDLPTAFQEANYNQIIFFIGTYKNTTDKFFISNIKLAEAGSDTRHKLIETGTFTTNEILFDTNKFSIKPSSKTILDDLGKVLSENQNIKISIAGHTDSDGNDNENLKLSEKRAQSISSYFIANFGIQKSRMTTLGKGELEPIADNKLEEGKKQNRRVEFNIIK